MPGLRIAVAGRTGRMARAVVEALAARDDMSLAGVVGRDARIPPGTDAVVDFTTPAAAAALASACAQAGGPALVLGATGWTQRDLDAVGAAARHVPVVLSGNFSLGINLLLHLAEQAASTLGADYDAEIVEAHHRRKRDAPSGTALMLADAVARAGGRRPAAATDRSGPRVAGEIGFAVVRAGGVVGEHSVIFAAEEEIITLSHSARDRGLFARGALTAAAWIAARSPGLYDMQDVLGLKRRP